ncbi:hypothetical protein, partial [Xanthomonas vasicola]
LVPMRRRGWILPAAGLALAAVVALVAIAPGIDRQAPPPAAAQPVLVTQAQALAEHYQQAIADVPVQQVPVDLLPALDELDRSTQAIHAPSRRARVLHFCCRNCSAPTRNDCN